MPKIKLGQKHLTSCKLFLLSYIKKNILNSYYENFKYTHIKKINKNKK